MNHEQIHALLRSNQRFLVLELQSRGIAVTMIDEASEILQAALGEHKEFLSDIDSSISPHALCYIAEDKIFAKHLLASAGISVPKGRRFRVDERIDAFRYARELGYPIVVKPCRDTEGECVHVGLQDEEELTNVLESLDGRFHGRGDVLMEEFFSGKEYRIFVTMNGDFAVLARDAAHVIGNGRDTVSALAEAESHRRMHPRLNCLCPIPLDDIAARFLSRTGKDFTYIPREGEKVYLRQNSNVGTGGTAEDFTDKVHPSAIRIAQDALTVFPGLPYAGIDFMSKDIEVEQTPDLYRIIEVNTLPGLGMHMAPSQGTPRNVAAMVADLIFPETATRS